MSWVLKGELSIPNGQGGKGTGNSRKSTDKGTETCKSMASLGTAGNQWLELRGREVGVEDMIRAVKLM